MITTVELNTKNKTHFCPNCGRLAEYDVHYDRIVCTSCNWRSEKITRKVQENSNYPRLEFCPKCNRIAEYDNHFVRMVCTSCDWRSEKIR